MKFLSMLLLFGVLLVAGCASPIPPAEPSAMVPKMLKASIPAGTSIYVERTTLGSVAAEGRAPFDEMVGTFPLVQEEGLANYQESIRLALVSAGAQSPANAGSARHVLRPVILGGMVISVPEAYSILFVHYQLEDAKTGKMLWSKNVYSQAKLEMGMAAARSDGQPNPAYALLAAGNLRQMLESLSDWLAAGQSNPQ